MKKEGDIIVIVIVLVALLLLFLVARVLKIPKCGAMTLVTGGVKTGKTTMSVWLALRQYNRNLWKWRLYTYVFYPTFHWIPFGAFRRMKQKEKPLFYANVPVAVKNYVPLTHDLLERRKRFRYGSVIYVCEASLVADSQSIKDQLVNEALLLFNKLVAHMTKGGSIYYDTQSILDCHYAVKRTLSTYLYIHHMVKVPFFCLCWVREMKFSEDNSAVNTFQTDVEDTLKLVIIPKSVWKLFDCYCYSVLTDHCEVVDQTVPVLKRGDKKARRIVSFRDYKTVPKEFIDGKTENKN